MPTPPRKRLPRELGAAAREFTHHPSPWMIGGMAVAATAGRLAVGDWQYTDALIPLVAVAIFPFVEWVIHTSVLHWRPKTVAGLTLDSRLARDHRRHHAAPRDVPLIFIPWQTLLWLVPVLIVLAAFAFPRPGLGLTFLMTVGVMGLAYEWTHYLIHTDYKPKSRLYRATWINHRHHHFKNEHYWFTVTTSGTADRVLGTYPDPAAIPTSPTSRNLFDLEPQAPRAGG
ncbi:sterol desaturase family protein [Nocardia sp. NPDC005825]|uniref:sterol desaturase family protein n=1 Tax=unclassified Nocardia TaxID=2637762 RepID=UPI0033FDCB88